MMIDLPAADGLPCAQEFPPPQQTAPEPTPVAQYEFDETEAPELDYKIKTAPKIRDIFWCNLWTDAVKPEFWKNRPVIVISYKNTFTSPCLVVPMTTSPQGNNPWSIELMENYVNRNRKAWVVCNHLITVSPSRLSTVRGKSIRMREEEFNPILKLVLTWLPKLP